VSPLLRLKLFVLVGALLLFGMEPLVGKLLLPNCGGGFHVWATCLMFFQGALFLGYLYCHFGEPRIGRAHLAVLLLPLALLTPLGVQVEPDPTWPVGSLLLALTLHIGLPFFALATTGVVAQGWLARSQLAEANQPYQLYAMSNLGSLVALLSYPVLVEPLLGLEAQRWVWTVGYLIYLVLAFWSMPRNLSAVPAAVPEPEPEPEPASAPAPAPEPNKGKQGKKGKKGKKGQQAAKPEPAAAPSEPPAPPEPISQEPPTWRRLLYWLCLATAPSMFLMAVTNVIALDIGSMPLVWVLPLSIYLLSFILTFGRRPFMPYLVKRFWLEVCLVGVFFYVTSVGGLSWLHALGHMGVLLVLCLAGHGELYRSRPAPRHLTTYYLVLSLGGWAGGVFVSLIAPSLFSSLLEYPVAIGLLALTLLVGRWKDLLEWLRDEPLPLLAGSVVLVTLVAVNVTEHNLRRPHLRLTLRNSYGVYRVSHEPSKDPALSPSQRIEQGLTRLFHGTTLHGKQLGGARRTIPIGYYHQASPLGDVMRAVSAGSETPRKVAVIGLGAGTTAAYLGQGEEVDFYELDPDANRIAEEYFTYLSDARHRGVDVEVIHGDARLTIQRSEVPEDYYDVILVDAFSSDAIPTHLLTREALTLFLGKLRPGGYLVFHISNRYYDLRPVLHAGSQGLGARAIYKDRATNRTEELEDASDYCVLRHDGYSLEPLLHHHWSLPEELDLREVEPWTDDYANLLSALWARYLEQRELDRLAEQHE
jgi:SAM-dependent methyltransferase